MPASAEWPEHVSLRPPQRKPRLELNEYEALSQDGAEERGLCAQYAEAEKIGPLFERLNEELLHELPHDPVEYLTDLLTENPYPELCRPLSEDDVLRRKYRPKKPFRIVPHEVVPYNSLPNAPSKTTHVRGLVVGSDGQGISGASVRVVRKTDVLVKTAPNGGFAVEAMAPTSPPTPKLAKRRVASLLLPYNISAIWRSTCRLARYETLRRSAWCPRSSPPPPSESVGP